MNTALEIIGFLGFVVGVAIVFALVVYFFAYSVLPGFKHLRDGRPIKLPAGETQEGIWIDGGNLIVDSMKYRLRKHLMGFNHEAFIVFDAALAKMLANRTPHPSEAGETFVQVSAVSERPDSLIGRIKRPLNVIVTLGNIALFIILLGGFNFPKANVKGLIFAMTALVILELILRFSVGRALKATRWSCSSGVLRMMDKKSRERSLALNDISKLNFLPFPDGFILHLDLREGKSTFQIKSLMLSSLLPLYDCIVRHRPELAFRPGPSGAGR